MRRTILLICVLGAAAIFVVTLLQPKPAPPGNTIAVNEVMHFVEDNAENLDALDPPNELEYTVLQPDGTVLYASSEGLSEDLLSAVKARDTIVPVTLPEGQGLVLIANDLPAEQGSASSYVAAAYIVATASLSVIALIRFDHRNLRPLRNMKSTAEKIARGNLDVPLPMDKGNVLGAFTESFDLMRSELSRSRAAQTKAAADQKELVAKLSHDLRTPIASIRAVAELGALKALSPADRKGYEQIASKAEQMNLLVTNLLNASLHGDVQFAVTLRPVTSEEIAELLEAADYLHWMMLQAMPSCTAAADPVRLLQVFDNIFSNAYKYASGPVCVAGFVQDGELLIEFEDRGGGVDPDETGSLRMRYFRGKNAAGTEGAGLGLYICDQLLRAMRGELLICSTEGGLRVTVILPLDHKVLRKP